jgi:hypothetical protein
MRCLATAGKQVKNIRAIARQLPIANIEGLLEAFFFLLGPPRGEDSRATVQLSEVT